MVDVSHYYNASTSITINNNKYTLSADVYRSFMPNIDPPDGIGLIAYITFNPHFYVPYFNKVWFYCS